MKPLATNQYMLSWISVLPAEKSTIKWKKVAFKIFPLFLIVSNLAGAVASIAFFVKYITIDLEESLYALFQIAGNHLRDFKLSDSNHSLLHYLPDFILIVKMIDFLREFQFFSNLSSSLTSTTYSIDLNCNLFRFQMQKMSHFCT